MTQPQGNLELEIWNEAEAPEAGGFDDATTLHRIELECGLLDKMQAEKKTHLTPEERAEILPFLQGPRS